MEQTALGFVSALPLLLAVGPVAALLMEVGATHGPRHSWAAPVGVASADLFWASVSVAAGVATQRVLRDHEQAIASVAATVLLVWGVRILVEVVRPRIAGGVRSGERVGGDRGRPDGGGREGGAGSVNLRPTRARRQALLAGRFFGVTVANPLTLLAFASLSLGVGPGAGAGWAFGVASASLVVHSGWLVLGGSLRGLLGSGGVVLLRVGSGVALVLIAIHTVWAG